MIGPNQSRYECGFTLIEVIITMVLLAIVSTVIIGMQGALTNAMQSANKQESVMHAQQECAEEIMLKRQKLNFSELTYSNLMDPDNNPITPPPICENLVNYFKLSGRDASKIIAVSGDLTHQDTAGCPEGVYCKTITIPAEGENKINLFFTDFQL